MATKMLSLRLLRPGRRPNVMHTAAKKKRPYGSIRSRQFCFGGPLSSRRPQDAK
jgi:hypothetical protein